MCPCAWARRPYLSQISVLMYFELKKLKDALLPELRTDKLNNENSHASLPLICNVYNYEVVFISEFIRASLLQLQADRPGPGLLYQLSIIVLQSK